MEKLAKRLEETWGSIHSDEQITNIASRRPDPQGKATWETDPTPLMVNHPTRVTDSVYLCNSMDNQDRQNTLAKLETTNEWTIWKTRDKEWAPAL